VLVNFQIFTTNLADQYIDEKSLKIHFYATAKTHNRYTGTSHIIYKNKLCKGHMRVYFTLFSPNQAAKKKYVCFAMPHHKFLNMY